MIDSKMYLLTFTAILCTFCVQTSLSEVDENSENRCPEGYGYIGGECMKKFVKPEFVQCPTPDLKFGNYELQLEGRVIDYWCEDGWTLVPDEFASAACILGAWSTVVPQCVRPGCDELQAPSSGELEYSYEGALVTFRCNSDKLILSGEPVLGCDGQFWNWTVPQCVEPKTSGAKNLNANIISSSFKSLLSQSLSKRQALSISSLLLQTIFTVLPPVILFVNHQNYLQCIP